MQLQQLRYLIASAEYGSFREAANKLYVSQSSISVAVKELEQETGITVFERTSRGIMVTNEGAELMDYARAVIEQADLLESRYSRANRTEQARLDISSQHYSIVVDAFGDFVRERNDSSCAFALHESFTSEIIRDVQELRSDLGFLYLSSHNDRVVKRALDSAGLSFTSLYVAKPHIIVHKDHRLASRKSISVDDLSPFYRFEREQGFNNSSYFAEEPVAALPQSRRIVVNDNGTLSSLLERTNGYALGTGAFLDEGRFSSVPLDVDEYMNVGLIRRHDAQANPLAEEFLGFLALRILAFDGPITVSPIVFKLSGTEADSTDEGALSDVG